MKIKMLKMKEGQKFKVSYELHTYHLEAGEFTPLPKESCEIETDTNDMQYLFIDISELHRNDNVFGLKITQIMNA